jgi:hypothetical protein
MRVAKAAQPGEETRRGHDDAGLALNRLDQDCRSMGRDRALKGCDIAERQRAKTRGERAEALSIVGLARE